MASTRTARRAYETKTERNVKQALLALMARKPLADITISELAREAGISRSTFYEHYGNPADVYDSLVEEFSQDVTPLMEQFTCSETRRKKGAPFCVKLREQGPYASMINEGRFMDTFLGMQGNVEQHDIFNLLTSAGYTPEQARALAAFQMSGCFSAARAAHVTPEEWESVRPVIDRFILGGISACLAAKRKGATESEHARS